MAQNIIWVWGENGPDAALESALSPPHLLPDPSEEERQVLSRRIQLADVGTNDLAYGWDTLVENLVVRETGEAKREENVETYEGREAET